MPREASLAQNRHRPQDFFQSFLIASVAVLITTCWPISNREHLSFTPFLSSLRNEKASKRGFVLPSVRAEPLERKKDYSNRKKTARERASNTTQIQRHHGTRRRAVVERLLEFRMWIVFRRTLCATVAVELSVVLQFVW